MGGKKRTTISHVVKSSVSPFPCVHQSTILSFHLALNRWLLVSLALWEPVEVVVGAVGYVLKPTGKFVTLFNAISPSESSDPRVKTMPSIAGYGKVSIGHHRHAARNAALRGFDAVVGFLSSGKRDESQAKWVDGLVHLIIAC
jgi:hypothetical protein